MIRTFVHMEEKTIFAPLLCPPPPYPSSTAHAPAPSLPEGVLAGILILRVVVRVHRLHVVLEVRVLRRSVRAQPALVGALARVRAQVEQEVCSLRRPVRAV